jgi:hypothetical protein
MARITTMVVPRFYTTEPDNPSCTDEAVMFFSFGNKTMTIQFWTIAVECETLTDFSNSGVLEFWS